MILMTGFAPLILFSIVLIYVIFHSLRRETKYNKLFVNKTLFPKARAKAYMTPKGPGKSIINSQRMQAKGDERRVGNGK